MKKKNSLCVCFFIGFCALLQKNLLSFHMKKGKFYGVVIYAHTQNKTRIGKGLMEPVLFFKDIKSKMGKNRDLTKCSSGKIWTILIDKN